MANIFNIIPGPQEDTCYILLYGEIGHYGDITAQDVVARLLDAERTYKKIDVRINSIGGEVDMGIAIFNALHQSTSDITIYIDCLAASTASFIASCGKPVKMSRYGRMMIHRPSVCAFGDASKLQGYIAQLEQIENTICQIYADRTKIPVEQIRKTYMDGADHWLTADEALSLGFVDEIYDDPNKVTFADKLDVRQMCEQYTARYINATNVSHNNSKQMIEKLKSTATFRDCADEAAIMNRIAEIEAKAEKYDAVVAERNALQTKVDAFEQKEQQAIAAAIDKEVNDAILDGRINETQRDNFISMLHSEKAEEARAILASLPVKRRATAHLGDPGTDKKTSADLLAERVAEVKAKLNH